MQRFLILFSLAIGLCACASHDSMQKASVSLARESPTPVSPSLSPTPHINREELTLSNGLRIVRREIKLENKKFRYRIDVAYPEIRGLPYGPSRVLNREIRTLIKKAYRWPMLLETRRYLLRGKYLRHDKTWDGVFNSVDLEYDVVQASDELLSIYFIGYHYGIGGAHSVHESFTVNYDLRRHQLLTLTSLFKSKTQPLKLISQKSIETLSTLNTVWPNHLKPTNENFASWNITPRGLRLNFDACRVTACAAGDLDVEIPFEALKEVSTPGSLLNNAVNSSRN